MRRLIGLFRTHPEAMRAHADAPDRWMIGPLLLFALVCLVFGIVQPAMEVDVAALFGQEISILDGAEALWDGEQYFLFIIIIVFSILFPLTKIALGLWAWYRADLSKRSPLRVVRGVEQLGKWSMLDVFVIAIVVAALSIDVVAGVFVHEGLYLFTASVVIAMVAMGRLEKIAVDIEQRQRGFDPPH